MKKKLPAWSLKAAAFAAGLGVCLTVPLVPARAVMEENTAASSAEAARIDREDGEYNVDVTLKGGSGRAFVVSPAVLTVRDGYAYARLEWSSSAYDYMKLGEKRYDPVNTEGNSVFEIPVPVFGEEIPVIADTTAMSTPHEISYTLTFYPDSIQKKAEAAVFTAVLPVMICLAAGGTAGVFLYKKKQWNRQ